MVKVAYIEWEDARGLGGSRSTEVMKTTKTLILKSAGILISEDETAVRLAQDQWSVDEENLSRDIEIIPRRNIRKFKSWEVK